MVAIEVELETILELPNGGTFDDLEYPKAQFQGHPTVQVEYLANITSRGFLSDS